MRLLLLLFGNLFDVAVLVLLDWCEALLDLWLCLAVCLCGELGGLFLFLGDLLLLDVFGSLWRLAFVGADW